MNDKQDPNNKVISAIKKTKIKTDYLAGMPLKEIAEKHKIPKVKIRNLINNQKWRKDLDELKKRIELQAIDKIAERKSDALFRMHAQSQTIINKVMKEFENEKNWESQVIEDKNGNLIRVTNYDKLEKLGKLWTMAWSRQLRALGEPDTLREMPLPEDDEDGKRIIQVMAVGLTPEYQEKVVRAKELQDKANNQ